MLILPAWMRVSAPSISPRLVKVSEIVTLKSVTEELRAKFTGKFKDDVIAKNVKAVERAYEEVD